MSIAAPAPVIIAALDRRGAIGRDNALPWHLPDDLRRFKALTLGHPVLMGRRTAESLGRALPKRRNLVLSRHGEAPFTGMETFRTLDDAFAAVAAETLMVIGGGHVFAAVLPRAGRMYLTHVDTLVDDADAFFPPFDREQWDVVARERHDADERHPHAFEFVDYRRKVGR